MILSPQSFLPREVDAFRRVGPADFKFAIGGHLINLGDDKSQNALPQTLFASRHGLETLLRRLVVGNKHYPNIEQMVGTVTGVISSATDPTKVQGVSVRTSSGEQVISASLVVGMHSAVYLICFVCNILPVHRLLRCCTSRFEMVTTWRFWNSRPVL